MSSKTTSTYVGTTTSGTIKYYSSKNIEVITKGAVILCQHGFQGYEGTMRPLLANLKANPLSKGFDFQYCESTLDYTTLGPECDAIQEIKRLKEENPEANILVRTLFSNPKWGGVITQACELREIIRDVKVVAPDAPIIVVGYSKGGVVNCKCAIENPGLIDKIVNIATPHTDTFVQDIVYIIGEALKDKWGTFAGIGIPAVKNAINALTKEVDEKIDTLMNNWVTYKDLKKEWNRMANRPKFTVIAGEAIEIDGEFEGDFVVPDYSAKALGFYGKTNTFVVNDEKVTIKTEQIKKELGKSKNMTDLLSTITDSLIEQNPLKVLQILSDIMLNYVQNDKNLTKCLKLAHTNPFGDDFILTHSKVGYRVLEGINA